MKNISALVLVEADGDRDDMTYRFIQDDGHGWLEVPRREVQDCGASITPYSYYDPATDMVYLEEDCDATAFLNASNQGDFILGQDGYRNEWSPRGLPSYEPEDD